MVHIILQHKECACNWGAVVAHVANVKMFNSQGAHVIEDIKALNHFGIHSTNKPQLVRS